MISHLALLNSPREVFRLLTLHLSTRPHPPKGNGLNENFHPFLMLLVECAGIPTFPLSHFSSFSLCLQSMFRGSQLYTQLHIII